MAVHLKLKLRGRRWIIQKYDSNTQRTERISCRTQDKDAAERAFEQYRMYGRILPAEPSCRAKHPWLTVAKHMCKRARERARTKNRSYELTPELVLEMILAQDYRCAVTGIAMKLPQTKRDPWAPSLDQIQAGRGYGRDNVRVVAAIVNMAMNQWGEVTFRELLRQVGAPLGRKIRTLKSGTF